MTTARRGAVSLSLDPFTSTSEGVFRGPIFLAKIELPAYGANPAKTLKLSTREYVDPDGVPWEPVLLEHAAIDQGGGFLETSWQPVDAEIYVFDKRITGQGASETFLDLLVDYEFVGSTVTLYQAFDNLTAVSQFRVIFEGQLAEVLEAVPEMVRFYCVQDRSWDRPSPPGRITPALYPRAPRESMGLPAPVVFGDWMGENNRERYPLSTGGYMPLSYAALARGAYPCVAVETEDATNDETPTFLISDEPMHTSPTSGDTSIYRYEGSVNALARAFTFGTITSDPVTFRLADRVFEVPLLPNEKHPATTALRWQDLLREDKPTLDGSFCSVNSLTVGTKILKLFMPDVASLGTLDTTGMFLAMFYRKSSSTSPITWGVLNPATTVDSTTTLTSLARSAVAFATVTVSSGTLPAWESVKDCVLYLEVADDADWVDIYRLALIVTYKPTAKLVRPGVTRTFFRSPTRFDARGRVYTGGATPTYQKPGFEDTGPDIYQYADESLFAFGKGVKDDASGTYTGTANALIEHPVDVTRWLLTNWGGLTSGNLVTAPGDFGSFTDARSGTLSGYKMLAHYAQDRELEDIITDIGRQTLTWFYCRANEGGNPWVAVPWDTTATVNYRSPSNVYTFSNTASDVVQGSFKAGRTRLSSLVNSIRVNYDHDPRTNSYADQLYITPDGSRVYSGGFTTDGTRVTASGNSVARHGLKESTLNLSLIRDPATASSVLTRLHDLRVEPRVVVEFQTWVNAYDLERGHVIQFSSDWDTYIPYPKPGSNGSWASKKFRVVRVRRSKDRPIMYSIVAVEV